MIEIIRELKTIDSDTLVGFVILGLIGLYIFMNGLALIVKNFRK